VAESGWWVYVIECESGAWYTGVTNDLERRFQQHADGKGAKYFRMDAPKRIVAAKSCETKGEALSQEAELKQLPRESKRGWITENPHSGKTAR
jgi:putative endonuclease